MKVAAGTDGENTALIQPHRPAMRGYWAVGLIMAGLALCMFPFDLALTRPDNVQGIPGDLKRLVHLSEIFAHGFGVAIAAVGIWYLASDKRRFIPRVLCCALIPSIGVHLLKGTVGRLRPINFVPPREREFPTEVSETWLGWLPEGQINLGSLTQSFPSGHAATAWGLAIGLAWVFPKGRWLFFSLAAVASIQRVASFSHWPSDVLVGSAIGFVMAGMLTENWGIGKSLSRWEHRRSTPADLAEATPVKIQDAA